MNKIIKNSGKILISGLLIFSLAGCGKVPVLKNGEEAVVTSNAKNISVTEFYEKIKEKYGVNVLVDMIDEMILNDKYKETTKEEKEYIKEKVKEVEDSAKQYNTTFEYLISYYYGLETKTEFEKFVSLSYRRNEAVKELVGKDITDKEIQKYYDENIFGDIRTKHILISIDTLDGMTTEEKNNKEKEALNKAKDIIKKLNNGEDFDKLAKEYSTDKATKDKGGDTGWFNTGDMLEEFEKAAYALKKGTYTTTPVKTKYGYHIIYKTDEKKKPELKDVKSTIKETLVTKKLSEDSALFYKKLEELRKEYGVEIHDDKLNGDFNTYMSKLKTSSNNSNNK